MGLSASVIYIISFVRGSNCGVAFGPTFVRITSSIGVDEAMVESGRLARATKDLRSIRLLAPAPVMHLFWKRPDGIDDCGVEQK